MRRRARTPRRGVGALSSQEGQTSTEYLGVLVVVAAVAAALVLTGPGIGEALGGGIRQAICRITAGDCGGGQSLTQGGGTGSDDARGNSDDARPSGESGEEGGGGVLDGVGTFAGDVAGGVADAVGGGIRGGRAFLNGLVAGDANREGYDNPFLEGARGAGHLVSGILVLGDVRDIGVAGQRIITSGEGWGDLGLSVVGLVPFLGDGTKAIKGGKGVVDAAQEAGDIARRTEQAEDAARVPNTMSDDVLRGPGPRGGESSAAARGREAHKGWDYGPGFEPEFRLPSGRRVDAINFETRQIVELKPNNPRAIRSGQRQLDDYLVELNREYPGAPWTGQVEIYDP